MSEIPLRPMPMPGQQKTILGRDFGPGQGARMAYASLVSAADAMDSTVQDMERRLEDLRASMAERHRTTKTTAADLAELRAKHRARRLRGAL